MTHAIGRLSAALHAGLFQQASTGAGPGRQATWQRGPELSSLHPHNMSATAKNTNRFFTRFASKRDNKSVHFGLAGAQATRVVVELHIGMVGEQRHRNSRVGDPVADHKSGQALPHRVVMDAGLPN